jgi:hypothetical protein
MSPRAAAVFWSILSVWAAGQTVAIWTVMWVLVFAPRSLFELFDIGLGFAASVVALNLFLRCWDRAVSAWKGVRTGGL